MVPGSFETGVIQSSSENMVPGGPETRVASTLCNHWVTLELFLYVIHFGMLIWYHQCL